MIIHEKWGKRFQKNIPFSLFEVYIGYEFKFMQIKFITFTFGKKFFQFEQTIEVFLAAKLIPFFYKSLYKRWENINQNGKCFEKFENFFGVKKKFSTPLNIMYCFIFALSVLLNFISNLW